MKTTHIYLLAIGLLMYMSYSANKDQHQLKQQQAEIHKLYCSKHSCK